MPDGVRNWHSALRHSSCSIGVGSPWLTEQPFPVRDRDGSRRRRFHDEKALSVGRRKEVEGAVAVLAHRLIERVGKVRAGRGERFEDVFESAVGAHGQFGSGGRASELTGQLLREVVGAGERAGLVRDQRADWGMS